MSYDGHEHPDDVFNLLRTKLFAGDRTVSADGCQISEIIWKWKNRSTEVAIVHPSGVEVARLEITVTQLPARGPHS